MNGQEDPSISLRASKEVGEVRWKIPPAPRGNRGSQEGKGKSGGRETQQAHLGS